MRDSSSTATKRLNVTEVVLSRGTRRSIYCLLGKNWPFQQLHVNVSASGMSLNLQTKSGRGYCHPSQANNFIQHGIGLNSTSNTMTVMLQHIIRDIISIYKSNIIMNKNEIKLADHLPDYYFFLPFRVGIVGMPLSFKQAEQYHFSGVGSLRPTQARWNYRRHIKKLVESDNQFTFRSNLLIPTHSYGHPSSLSQAII